MQFFGVDFTSSPRKAKPIYCACGTCSDDGQTLDIESLLKFESLDEFESWLQSPGPWIAAVDFPLGQPRRLVNDLNWPHNWTEYVRQIGEMSKPDFVEMLDQYRDGQPPGEKHHFRKADRVASACSPMMLYGVPVAKMFFEGAPRVERAGGCVPPCRINKSNRVVVEGYPARIVRELIGNQPYKTERVKAAGDTRAARRSLIQKLCRNVDLEIARVRLARGLQTCLLEDFRGDAIDAVLCAVQAVWCYQRRDEAYGIPEQADPLEGWIAGYAWE